jgi:hypothetical protein
MTHRFNINQQIEELDREIRMRNDVYPRWVRTGKMKQSFADYCIARIAAARATLVWIAENENEIREWVSQKKTAGATPPAAHNPLQE